MAAQEQIDAFVVTARKWRPQLFKDVVGQDHISTTLSNALLTHRVHHAYLFCGPRGVGKTTTARIFARALNCSNPTNGVEPCNECDSCRDILSARSLDVIEIDGASNNSVDDIRKLRENAKYPPVHGKYKMYIIDEVHMLSTSAFNALLKTLEEPPPHLLFMFATTESHKVPATIVSRCQRFDFRRMQVDDIVKHISYIAGEEHVQIDEASLVAIARKGDGSMRDAQSIFDQVRAFCGDVIQYRDVSNSLHLIDEEFFFSISDAIRERNAAVMFELVQQVMTRGYDIHECLSGLIEHFRNILTVVATDDTKLIEASSATLMRYKADGAHFKRADVLRIMTMINTTEQQLKFSAQPRFRFELLLSQLASMDSTIEIAQLLSELRDSKKNGSKIGMLNAVVHATMPTAKATLTIVDPPRRTPERNPLESATDEYAPSKQRVVASPVQPSPLKQTSHGTLSADTARPNQALKTAAPAARMTSRTEYTAPASAPEGFSEAPAVRAGIIQSGWGEFVKTLPQSQAAIKLCLNTTDICAVRFFDGEVVILSSEKFMCDDLHSRRVPFGHHLEKFFGSSIKIKIVHTQNIHDLSEQHISDSSHSAVETGNGAVAENGVHYPTENGASAPVEKLPLESAIVELFGAKKIPMSSN